MRNLWLIVVAFLFLSAVPASAADPIEADLLSIDEQGGRLTAVISIVDGEGQAMLGLTASNFRATLDGEPVLVTSAQTASAARESVAVVLAVDVSGSMQGVPLDLAKQATEEFVKGLDPADEAAVVAFAKEPEVLQALTSDKKALTEAIGGLIAAGDTALYGGVIEAAGLIGKSTAGRRLIVLLSDGLETVDHESRETSVQLAKDTGVPIIAIGLGSQVDVEYLSTLTSATGGQFIEAPTASTLADIYENVANVIRNQYVVRIAMPAGMDRSVPARLRIDIDEGTNHTFIERTLEPLPGAVPPPFDLSVTGFTSGDELRAAAALTVSAPEDVRLASVEYSLDGQAVQTTDREPFVFEIAPAGLIPGNHIVNIVAKDESGRVGERQVIFSIPLPATKKPDLPIVPAMAALAVVAIIFLLSRRIRRRKKTPAPEKFTTRIKPWSERITEAKPPAESPRHRDAPLAPPTPKVDRPLGRVIVLHESSIREGKLGLDEYEIRSSPLTVGSSQSCDIVLQDPDGRIAGEEARIWVQKGRLVYHRLTTLSAMATEGVTSGWQLLNSGEELKLGPYRLTFQPMSASESDQADVSPRVGLQELWPRIADDSGGLRADTE